MIGVPGLFMQVPELGGILKGRDSLLLPRLQHVVGQLPAPVR
jgi:hypothetical protein